MAKNLDMNVRQAYFSLKRNKEAFQSLKRRLEFQFAIYLIALILVAALQIANFAYYNTLLRIWSVILVLLLLVKISYDTVQNMRRQYTDFMGTQKGKLA